MNVQLGFCKIPEPIYLYVKKEEIDGKNCLWYQVDHDNSNRQIPIEHKAIAGYLQDIRITIKEFKDKENTKLELVISADDAYVIRSGIDTIFSKTILLALSQVSDFTKPLIFAVQPGNENVVFGKLYCAEFKQRVSSEWNPDADFYGMINQIKSAICGNKAVSLLDTINKKSQFISALQRQNLEVTARDLKLNWGEAIAAIQNYFEISNINEFPANRYDAAIEYLHVFTAKIQPWTSWKSPSDAIAWGKSQLPAHSFEFLEQEFNVIPATNGKKAPAWVKRVEELKSEF